MNKYNEKDRVIVAKVDSCQAEHLNKTFEIEKVLENHFSDGENGYTLKNEPEWFWRESQLEIVKSDETKHTLGSKTYKISKIVEMIENGGLKDDDVVIDKNGKEINICSFFKNWESLDEVIESAPYTIKQKPVDYIVAVNSGRKIKPISLLDKGYHEYTYWLGYMVSSIAYGQKPIDLINGLWLIKND